MGDNFTEQNYINVGILRYNNQKTRQNVWMTSIAVF